ncbi:MAG TPA: hypothetical protein VGJ04_08040 [Pirellulales bacterium]|jgi:hypothetical protein
MKASAILLLGALIPYGTICTNQLCHAEDINIEGWISTANDQPVANVVVKIWRQSKVIQSATTDQNGHYAVTAVEGSPIDAITFDPPDITQFGPGAIDHLSGKRNQKIGAVLYDTGELSKVMVAAIEGRSTNVGPLVGQKNQLKRVMSLESGAGASADKLARYASFAQKLAKKGAEAESKLRDPNLGIPKKGNDDDAPAGQANFNRQTAYDVVRELAEVHAN